MGVLRSGRRRYPESPPPEQKGDPAVEEQQQDEEEDAAHLGVFIAKFTDGSFYDHWAIYVEYPTRQREKSFICQAEGSAGNFYYSRVLRHARTYETIGDIYTLGRIRGEHAERLGEICASVAVRNDKGHNWNCQDWVYDAFKELVGGGALVAAHGVTPKEIYLQMDGVE